MSSSISRDFFMGVVILTAFLVCLSDCRNSTFIAGPIWKAYIESCNSWGEKPQTYSFDLPSIKSVGLTYEDFGALTTVVAIFKTNELSTKAVKNANVDHLLLYTYKEDHTHKEYEGRVGYTAACGWASQAAVVRVTLKVFEKGTLQLDTYVYAASWGAVSCAETRADISKLHVIY